MDVIQIQEDDFSLEREYELCRQRTGGDTGAIASFVGLVRDRNNAESVQELNLEHYPGMTEKSIESIVKQARERWQLLSVTVIHRIGNLKPKDQIVLVVVASSHRPDAFAGCEFIMDLLKTEAVFWKKEVGQQTEHWVKSTQSDHERRRDWE